MDRRIDGFIILSVLMLLYFFSLIVIYEINAVAVKTKYNQQRIKEQEYVNLSNDLLRIIEYNQPQCLIQRIAAEEVKKLPRKWWQAFACGGKVGKFQYYFVQELLDKDPCGLIQHSNSMIAAYYRVTLILLSQGDEVGKKILQSVVVKAENASLPCIDKTHIVPVGRQILREI